MTFGRCERLSGTPSGTPLGTAKKLGVVHVVEHAVGQALQLLGAARVRHAVGRRASAPAVGRGVI